MFSLYVVPLFLCLIPLAVSLRAWQLGRRQEPALTRVRVVCFQSGVVISILTTLVTMSCWLDPFPLVHLPEGSLSTGWLDLAWGIGFGGAFVSIVLALFGRSWSRALLVLSGFILVLLAYGSLLQNGV
jgi:hypothetical protein